MSQDRKTFNIRRKQAASGNGGSPDADPAAGAAVEGTPESDSETATAEAPQPTAEPPRPGEERSGDGQDESPAQADLKPASEVQDEKPRAAPMTGADERIGEERLASYHRYAREVGVNRILYFIARCFLQPIFLLYLRAQRTGREYSRVDGPLIVAANHRSFLDPFVLGIMLPWNRPLQYVAKVELFEKRWQGWILNRLGAYPVRRGKADADTVQTTQMALERGGAICIFPEGTRVRRGSLAMPHRGVGRLALETGASVLPVAVHGTEHVRKGWRFYPAKVKMRAGKVLEFEQVDRPSPSAAAAVADRVWPNIVLQWEWLGGLPPMKKAAVIGGGSWGTAVAVLLARGGLEVQLGCRTEEQAQRLTEDRENEQYLPGIELNERIKVAVGEEIEIAGVDLICLAVPSSALPATVAALGDRIGDRTGVLLLSKGLVPPAGVLPSDYIEDRVRGRAVASLGGPALAREAASGTAALVLASTDEDLRNQIGDVFDRSGLVCERSDDVIGVEVAGSAKNAAALAAAAAEPHGLNAAGIAAAEIWRECVAYALLRGGRLETFAGLAGIGDLTATVLAPGSRNRRAGELLGKGVPAGDIPEKLGQVSEALDSVPLIATTVAAAGVEANALEGLRALIEGEIEPNEWITSLRRSGSARTVEK